MIADILIVRTTELPNGGAVVTTRRAAPYLIRPYQTFVTSPASRYAQRLSDHTCAASALHQHDVLAREAPGEGECDTNGGEAMKLISINDIPGYTMSSVRGAPLTVPAWVVRVEVHRPPERGYLVPHSLNIWRYVHEKTARKNYNFEVRPCHHPLFDIRISLTDPDGNEVERFEHKARKQAAGETGDVSNACCKC